MVDRYHDYYWMGKRIFLHIWPKKGITRVFAPDLYVITNGTFPLIVNSRCARFLMTLFANFSNQNGPRQRHGLERLVFSAIC